MTDHAPAFLAALYTVPLRRVDALVVLCGEDAQARVDFALQLFKQEAAPVILLSGGYHQPPAILSAEHLAGPLMGQGIAPSRIMLERESQNTYQQAANVLARARLEGWGSLMLVASAYHLPRAFLTFVRAMEEDDKVRIVPVAASQSRWVDQPPGVDRTRDQLFAVELSKIGVYREHVATWGEGLAKLREWV